MSNIEVDTEKLAYGLKRGIGHTKTIFSYGAYNSRLRWTACGLVSAAINVYCQQQDIPSQVMIAEPRLRFDPRMRHVYPALGEQGQDPTIVDASYSQFLGYVGINADRSTFPKEEILVFKLSESDLTLNWLADYAVKHRGQSEPQFPLAKAEPDVIKGHFTKIWSADNSQPWRPIPYEVAVDGQTVAPHIPPGAITLH